MGRPKGRKNKTSKEKLADLLQVEVPSFVVQDSKEAQKTALDKVKGPVENINGVPMKPSDKFDFERDYQYSRSQYYRCLQTGNELLEGISRVADQGEHPRAYEVAATTLKVVADITKELVQLQKDMKELLTDKDKNLELNTGDGGEIDKPLTSSEIMNKIMEEEQKRKTIDVDKKEDEE